MKRIAAVLTLIVLLVVAAQSTINLAGVLLVELAVLFVLWLRRSCPRQAWPLAWSAVAGWTVACLAVSFSVSLMYLLTYEFDDLQAPQPNWVYKRAFIGGIFLAVIPISVTLWLVRRAVGMSAQH